MNREIGSAFLSHKKRVMITASICNVRTWSFYTDPRQKQFKGIHDKVICCGIYEAVDVSFR